MKYRHIIWAFVFLLQGNALLGQRIECEYYVDSKNNDKPRIVYGFFDGNHRDTTIDCSEIQIFEMLNPMYYTKKFNWVAKMNNLRELRLWGDDFDDIEELNKRHFRRLTKSQNLETIYLCQIYNAENFQKYLRNKRQSIKLTTCY